ncbi:hypothetical protein BJ878DRAFT_257166 [Calycina marina]|uniref:Uncharacterized protein n=1 Tax=Calycina marina TaxID=1763456 RepID=A0A9P7YVW4_9HELO|nr:hypothetical protein BJ878DRAFT_257166 [Calycina marina]
MFSFNSNMSFATSFRSEAVNENRRMGSFTSAKESSALLTLRESLEEVFPICNSQAPLQTPFCFQYEITQGFLHNGVAASSDLIFPRRLDYGEYDRFWAHLRKFEVLLGKPFPPKTDKIVWGVLGQDIPLGSHAVVMSGSLQYQASGPLFKLRLKPLHIDLSHRLERRFSSDRFLEIDIPSIGGTKIPKCLSDAGFAGIAVVKECLIESHQDFIGCRTWVSFCNKAARERERMKRNSTTH